MPGTRSRHQVCLPMLAPMVAPLEWLEAHLGPVEAIALSLSTSSTDGWDALLTAVDAHQLRVLDVEFVQLTASGVQLLSADEAAEFAPAEFAGASSGLLDAGDLAVLAPDLAEGEAAAVLLVEHLGLLNVLHAFESAGSRLLLDGLLDHDELDAAVGGSDS